MGTIEEEETDWRTKYETTNGRINLLESLSKDVLKEYDDLGKNNKHLKNEVEELRKKLASKDTQIKEATNLIEPAVTQYVQLKNKYKIEKGCRTHAQSFAANIMKENRDLKRQSMDMVNLYRSNAPIDPATFGDLLKNQPDEDKDIDNFREMMDNQLRELKNETAELKTSLTKCQEDLHIEQENYKWATIRYQSVKTQLDQTNTSLKQHKQALHDLSKVSEEAYTEYLNLKDNLEMQSRKRSLAEQKIEECEAVNMAMKRQSNMLMLKVLPNEHLHTAMIEIESLSDQLKNQQIDYENKIQQLQTAVELCSPATIDELVGDKKKLTEETEELGMKLAEYEKKYNTLETYNVQLQKKYDDAMRPPAPPPPPPPPPVQSSRGFLNRIMGKKKVDVETKLKYSGANTNADLSKAIEEMMKNIKDKKTTLKPMSRSVRPIKTGVDEGGHTQFTLKLKSRSIDDVDGKSQSSEDLASEEGGAMAELHKMVTKMKRTRSDSDLLASATGSETESEFAMKFKQIRKQASLDSNVPLRDKSNKLSLVCEDAESEVGEENDVFTKP